MKKIYILAIIFIFLISGCGSLSMQKGRETLISLSESDIKNVETLETVSNNLKETWPFYSGALDAYNESYGIHKDAIEMKITLDELYKSENWDRYAAGKALTLRAILVIELTEKGVEKVLPNFLKLLEPLL